MMREPLVHTNFTTTQIYTYLDFQHLAKVYDAEHPRAKRGEILMHFYRPLRPLAALTFDLDDMAVRQLPNH